MFKNKNCLKGLRQNKMGMSRGTEQGARRERGREPSGAGAERGGPRNAPPTREHCLSRRSDRPIRRTLKSSCQS